MATESRSKSSDRSNANKSCTKKGKQRYLPHNKPVKKGSYPLRSGVQGFFITCDGGRERQASHEAINVIDSFYDELVHQNSASLKLRQFPDKPLNKKTKFSYSDSSSSDDDGDNNADDDQNDEEQDEEMPGTDERNEANQDNPVIENSDPHKQDGATVENKLTENTNNDVEDNKCQESPTAEREEPPSKRQCLETDSSKAGNVTHDKVEKSIDKLIEAELQELGDRSKRRFSNLDSGCNGVVIIQMQKRDGDPSPTEIVHHMMTSVASTRKHISRFMLRVLPIEVTCYASEDEISKTIKPLIAKYFPTETQTAKKFAVLFEARANTGIDRMKIINAVAKSVPAPHKVDLSNPDKSIIVEIVKTVCMMGVVEKYKELAKYNVRQLTSSKP